MATCEMCGNGYDSGCTILGHGLEGPDESMFCCAHCARESGLEGVADRA